VIGLNLKTENKNNRVIIPNILNSFHKVFSGIEKVADEKAFIMCISNESMDKEAHTLEML
jgi:LacI family transcriptional regulator